jgi:HEPN domain-containing protein
LGAEVQIASLLWLASEDLKAARLLATQSNRNAAYLCSQAAEKVIRAVLTAEGKHAGIRHLLDEMVNLVPDENPLKPALRAVQNLGAYATTYRYPTGTGRIIAAPTAADLTKHMAAVDTALTAAAAAFAVDLTDSRKPAGRSHPPR